MEKAKKTGSLIKIPYITCHLLFFIVFCCFCMLSVTAILSDSQFTLYPLSVNFYNVPAEFTVTAKF